MRGLSTVCLSSSFIRPLDILLVFPSLPHLVVCSRLCFCYVTFNNHPTCHHSKRLTYLVCVLENVDKNSSTSKQRDREKRGKMKTKLIKLYFFLSVSRFGYKTSIGKKGCSAGQKNLTVHKRFHSSSSSLLCCPRHHHLCVVCNCRCLLPRLRLKTTRESENERIEKHISCWRVHGELMLRVNDNLWLKYDVRCAQHKFT